MWTNLHLNFCEVLWDPQTKMVAVKVFLSKQETNDRNVMEGFVLLETKSRSEKDNTEKS